MAKKMIVSVQVVDDNAVKKAFVFELFKLNHTEWLNVFNQLKALLKGG